MCRSIKTLRPPHTDDATPDDVEAAALQYVRKIAGMRQPSAQNREAFETAVQAVAVATSTLLRDVTVRPGRARTDVSAPGSAAVPAPDGVAAPARGSRV